MTDSVKPVVFKITLDTEDARKQLDALNRGGGKGSADAKGVPPAPKPEAGGARRAAGEAPGPRIAPGRGAGIVPGAPGASTAGSRFGGALGAINNAILNPGGVGTGVASAGIGAALGTAGAAVGIVAGTATLLEQIIPLVLSSLEKSLPDMPFFAEWRKGFDEISDWITEKRVALESVLAAFGETAGIASAQAQAGGTPDFSQLGDVFGRLKDIRKATGMLEADGAKERNKEMFHSLMKSLGEGIR